MSKNDVSGFTGGSPEPLKITRKTRGGGVHPTIRGGLHWITHPGRKFSFFLCFRGLWVVFGSSWKVFWGLEAS